MVSILHLQTLSVLEVQKVPAVVAWWGAVMLIRDYLALHSTFDGDSFLFDGYSMVAGSVD